MEKEPSFTVHRPNGEFEATRDNATLFRFMGALAVYDHIFFVRDEGRGVGTYLFKLTPEYERAADYMMDNDYPAHINLREVPHCDRDAYDKMLTKYASVSEGGVPAEWLKSD